MALFAELRARAWQVGCIASVTACLGLTATVGVVTLQRNAARADRDELHASINDPINGWVARFNAEHGMRMDAVRGLERQNAAVSALRQESDARVAAAERGWRDAQRAAAAARNQAEEIRAAQITGDTVCERVESVDAQILEALR